MDSNACTIKKQRIPMTGFMTASDVSLTDEWLSSKDFEIKKKR